MPSLLSVIGVNPKIFIRDDSYKMSLPQWAAFFLWAGWWARRNINRESRIVSVIVTPTRATSAAFSCLGALIASAQSYEKVLSWSGLVNLPVGTEVYFRHGRDSLQGTVKDLYKINGQNLIKISVSSKARRYKSSSISIDIELFREYTFSLKPPMKKKRLEACEGNAKYFSNIISGFEKDWFLSQKAECFLVTNKSRFRAEVENLFLGATQQDFHRFTDLLCLSEDQADAHHNTILTSPRSGIDQFDRYPLAVIDGLDALSMIEHIRSRNALILLDRTEFLEDARDRVLRLSNGHSGGPIPDSSQVHGLIPTGVEMTVFSSLSSDDRVAK
jgi:hypothetical protein